MQSARDVRMRSQLKRWLVKYMMVGQPLSDDPNNTLTSQMKMFLITYEHLGMRKQ